MLNYQMSRFFKTLERALVPGTSIKEEGVVLVLTRVNGELVAGPSTGAAGEVFGGFAISVNVPAGFSTAIGDFTVAATVELPRVPVVGQLFVTIDGVPADISVGDTAPSDAGKVTLNGSQLMFHADDVNGEGTYQFHYELTASEASAETGDYYPGVGNTPSTVTDSVGAVVEGQIATNMFDASVDWSTVINPSMGANGMLTVGGLGTKLTGVRVKSAPNAAVPVLVLEVE